MAEPSLLKLMRFERARIIGARALQVAMGAPIILERADGLLDPVRIAELEQEAGVIPITVHRPSVTATRPNAILPSPATAPAKASRSKGAD